MGDAEERRGAAVDHNSQRCNGEDRVGLRTCGIRGALRQMTEATLAWLARWRDQAQGGESVATGDDCAAQ